MKVLIFNGQGMMQTGESMSPAEFLSALTSGRLRQIDNYGLVVMAQLPAGWEPNRFLDEYASGDIDLDDFMWYAQAYHFAPDKLVFTGKRQAEDGVTNFIAVEIPQPRSDTPVDIRSRGYLTARLN